VTIALAGCGTGGSDAPTARTQTAPRPVRGPALCGRLRATVTGRVDTDAATELSGLVRSRVQPGVLWTHNDSGDSARVFAISTTGHLRAELSVPGAENIDWEDIAIGRATGGGWALFLADIGDNAEARPEIVVYSAPEPRLGQGSAATRATTAPAQRFALRYPDGPHDAETLLVDPSTGALVIVTKDFNGTARVYTAPRRAPGASTTLGRRVTMSLGPGEAITAGDVSADGRTVALRSYDRAYVFQRHGGDSLARTLAHRPCVAGADLIGEGQGEGLALAQDGRAFSTVPEGRHPELRRYAPAG
jgi:hypothetical protein